ncbi:MAG: ABC transporter permease, partial [Actinomycetes bacterium]
APWCWSATTSLWCATSRTTCWYSTRGGWSPPDVPTRSSACGRDDSRALVVELDRVATGLILAGVDPLTAIRYQIVVMYMLLGAAFLSAVLSARFAQRVLFDDADRLVRI